MRLEPLHEAHIPALVEAAALDRTHYQWTYTPDGPEQMTDYVDDALAKVASGGHVAFATVAACGGPGRIRRGRRRHALLRDGVLAMAARARATSATDSPTSSTSATPGWPDRPSGPT